jgi:hypothetical protein
VDHQHDCQPTVRSTEVRTDVAFVTKRHRRRSSSKRRTRDKPQHVEGISDLVTLVQDRAAKAIEETYGLGRVDAPTNQTEPSRAVAISLHELLSGALAGGMAIAHELPS